MRIIEAELKRILGVSAEISKTQYTKHGDFSSNVLMKHQLKFEDFDFTSEIIQDFQVVKGHLNMSVSEHLTSPYEGESTSHYRGRMKDVQARLSHEGYNGPTDRVVWPEMAKAYNLVNATMQIYGRVEASEVAILLERFEAYDNGHIYRKDSKEDLIAICKLLTYSIDLLERLTYEEHI